MIRKIFIWICLALFICLLPLGGLKAHAETSDKTVLEAHEDGSFTILLIADTQDTEKPQELMLELLRAELDNAKPDLVILLGDVIYGPYVADGKENAEAAIRAVVEPIVERGIPFAVAFGNHDDEECESKADQLAFYQSFPGCLNTFPDIPGVGNTCLKVVPNETVGAKACPILLFIVDSGTYAEEEIGGYDYVKPLQNEWIKNTAAEYGKASVAYVFQHIPVPQVQEFIEPARKFEIGAFCTYGSIFGDWYKEKEGALKEGHFRESPCPPLIDSGEFQAWKESNVKAAFFGHDHTNDYIGTLDGIDLVATPGIGFFSYGNGEGHGARIVTLHVDRPKEYETQVVCYRDLIDHPIGFLKGAYLGIQLQGTIVPALAGIALFLIAVVVVIILLVRRHQKKKAAKQADTEKGEQPS